MGIQVHIKHKIKNKSNGQECPLHTNFESSMWGRARGRLRLLSLRNCRPLESLLSISLRGRWQLLALTRLVTISLRELNFVRAICWMDFLRLRLTSSSRIRLTSENRKKIRCRLKSVSMSREMPCLREQRAWRSSNALFPKRKIRSNPAAGWSLRLAGRSPSESARCYLVGTRFRSETTCRESRAWQLSENRGADCNIRRSRARRAGLRMEFLPLYRGRRNLPSRPRVFPAASNW